jgi:hypothetical protein
MASNRFDDIFEQATHDLSREEQLKLIRELSKLNKATNGSHPQATRTLYDALNEDNMIGSITDAPPDLGTNPQYMEGFGKHAS